MSGFRCSEELSKEQSEAVEKAAYHIIKARQEADGMLVRAGMEPVPEGGWFGCPCGVTLPPPPQNHRCGCRNYTGDGGPCRTRYVDFTGPDLGSGPPTATCRHMPSQHLET
ncbi:DUF6422 family protein [Ferirhizobium litorale]|uniref:DUF6422 family protein n=1 Tax=Ferirhizobium litorale TaxID=2927786 RepID=UPI0035300CCC